MTIGIGGSEVRRAHLIVLAAMLVVAVAVGRVSEGGSSATQTTHVILPLDWLATNSVGSRVYAAMNHLRPGPTEGLSGDSQFRRNESFDWSPLPDSPLDDVRIERGSAA